MIHKNERYLQKKNTLDYHLYRRVYLVFRVTIHRRQVLEYTFPGSVTDIILCKRFLDADENTQTFVRRLGKGKVAVRSCFPKSFNPPRLVSQIACLFVAECLAGGGRRYIRNEG